MQTIVIIILASALACLILGIIIYCTKHQIRKCCHRIFHRKRRVHQITAPVKEPSEGDGEVVLAVTQRREREAVSISRHASSVSASAVTGATSPTNLTKASSVISNSTNNNNLQIMSPNEPRRPPPYLLTRHQSFITPSNISGRLGPGFNRGSTGASSDIPSNMSSLQSLLMSSQIAMFNSSSERLSFSSQNQLPFSLHRPQQQQNANLSVYSNSVSPAVSNSSFPQPSYFDERPPSYQESMLIRKLRMSNGSTGSRFLGSYNTNLYKNNSVRNTASPLSYNTSSTNIQRGSSDTMQMSNYRRSFRM